MSTAVLVGVLLSALLHGAWNAIAKAIPDRLASSTLIGAAYLALGGIGVLVHPRPDAAAWPLLLTSVVLQTGYLLLLTAAYARSPFSTTYPMARGLGVVGVTGVSVLALGERLSGPALVGVLAVIAGLLALAVRRGGIGRTALALTVAVGVTVAAYTLVDGVGVRASGTVLGYASWLFLLHGLATIAVCVPLGRRRPGYVATLRRHTPLGLLGGALSVATYAIVIWAQSQAPLPLVAALRETGVVMSGVIGYVVFRERPTVVRVVAAVAVCLGIVLIRVAG